MIRFYIYAALLIALSCGGFWLHHSGYRSGVAHEDAKFAAQVAKDAAKAQTQTVAADAGAKAVTDNGNRAIAQNEAAVHETVRTITKIVHDHPAGLSCHLPVDSLSALQREAAAANTAAGQL